jgi:hypothetical protein
VYAFWSIETIQFTLGSPISQQATLPIDGASPEVPSPTGMNGF